MRRRVLRTVAWIGLLVLVLVGVRSSVALVVRVPTASMVPAVLPGDVLLVDRTAYGWRPPGAAAPWWGARTPTPGDVVLVRSPLPGRPLWVKRVVAVAGEEVAFVAGHVVLDGAVPAAPALAAVTGTAADCTDEAMVRLDEVSRHGRVAIQLEPGLGSVLRDRPPVHVPGGHVFVVGDNRDRSVDGRRVGPTPVSDIVGRVTRVLISKDPCGGWRTGRVGMRVPPGDG